MSEGTQSVERALRARAMKRVLRAAVFLALSALVIYGIVVLAQGEEPTTEDRSVSYPIVGQEHIAEGAIVNSYNSNPPTSGPHYATPARVGFYEIELPDERLVHNLEHGDIWISYGPTVSDDVKQSLIAFAKDVKVIVTLRTKNETDIALASWGRADTFNLENGVLDEARVKDFITRFRNRGPEKVLNTSDMLPQQ